MKKRYVICDGADRCSNSEKCAHAKRHVLREGTGCWGDFCDFLKENCECVPVKKSNKIK